MAGPIPAHQGGGNLFGAVTGQKFRGKGLFVFIQGLAQGRISENTFVVPLKDIIDRWWFCPGGVDVCAL